MRIVLSSANAEKDCHQIFPETVDRTDVLPFRVFPVADWLACDPLDVIRKYRLPARYLLISNWMLPTKNHNFALDALTKIANRERESMHIVCTGDVYDYRNPGFYNQFMNKVHLLGLRNCVSHLGVIPKIDQISLLRGATAYLQPSLFEGWNTGVEEAHLFGKQVLLSDIPVHREQNPPGAIYFNPHVPDDLAARLREVFGAPRGGSSAFSVEAEQAALSSYETLQRDFARTFLMIADRAMTHSRAQM
jgi:glycosyltransferase involved in cell wall biosynthesis